MARPTAEEQRLLENLESAAAALCSARSLAGVLRVRLQMVYRRVGGDSALLRVVEPAIDQLDELAGDLHNTRISLNNALDSFQRRRIRQNQKRRKEPHNV